LVNALLEYNFDHADYKKRPKSKKQSSDWMMNVLDNKDEVSNLSLTSSLIWAYLYYDYAINSLEERHEHKDWLKNVIKQRNKLQNRIKFPDEVKNFVEKSSLPKDTLDRIAVMIKYIDKFLKSQNQEFKITPELFIDPEESESEEIKLRIQIKKDLEYIYNNLRSPIYNIVITTLPKEILRKILIKLEPL
jgi:hypothetical protein